jgi:hypothetical protein
VKEKLLLLLLLQPIPTPQLQQSPLEKLQKNSQTHHKTTALPKQQIKKNKLCRHRSPLNGVDEHLNLTKFINY